jgi:hypothetical protein
MTRATASFVNLVDGQIYCGVIGPFVEVAISKSFNVELSGGLAFAIADLESPICVKKSERVSINTESTTRVRCPPPAHARCHPVLSPCSEIYDDS